MSCEYCKELLKCPTNQKRKTVISEDHYPVPTKEEFSKVPIPIDVPIPIEYAITEMVIEKSDKKVEAFIHHSSCDIFKNHSNTYFNINNCPFCGQALREREKE